ncbi:MAG: Crp/Fnr family transcriptional regulator [Bacillota bacterium]
MQKRCSLQDALSPWIHNAFPNIKKYINEGEGLKIKKGTVLISPGERSNYLFYVLRGNLKTSLVHMDGQEKMLFITGLNSIIYEGTLLDNNISPVVVTALEQCEIIKFSREQIRYFLEKDHQFVLDLINFQSLKYKLVTSLHQDLLFLNPSERCSRILCLLSGSYDTGFIHSKQVALRLTQAQLAELLGLSRVTVANILKEMRNHNVISTQNKHLVLHEGFCEYCQNI